MIAVQVEGCQPVVRAGAQRAPRGVELGERLGVPVRLDLGLRAGDGCLTRRANGGDALARERQPVDPQALREPVQRRRRRTCLAKLDLTHVLLRKARAPQLALRESGVETCGPYARADPQRAFRAGDPVRLDRLDSVLHAPHRSASGAT